MAAAAAAAAWLGAWLGGICPWCGAGLGAAVAAAGMWRRRAFLIAAVIAAATGSGWAAETREAATLTAPVPAGPIVLEARVLDEPRPAGEEVRFPIRPEAVVDEGRRVSWEGPRLAVSAAAAAVTAGDRVRLVGILSASPGHLRGDPVAGRLRARSVEVTAGASDPLFRAGNLLRERVTGGLEPFAGRAEAALLAGFLIGDVRALPPVDDEALRLAGLSHFVAVSGSNVALFLAAWWLVAGPLGWGPRRRAVLGLVGLAVFVVVTRWEPSVVRAAVMAGIVLGGRLVGVPVDPWTALGGAVTLLLLVSADLAGDVGFQLSVAATAGVLAGGAMFASRRPRWVWGALGATAAAQAAVAPLLLIHFGSVPLFAPAANVVAAPLVVLATSVGGAGVLGGLTPLTALALIPARLVLAVARAAADLPQLGTLGVAGSALVAGAAAALPRLRPMAALAGAVAVALATVPPGPPPGPLLEVLDVGQGDAVLLRGPAGEVVLVDGGPDPRLLRRELRDRGISRIGLLVVTHLHADHTAGLVGLCATIGVDRAWIADQGGEGGAFDRVAAELEAAGVPTETPGAGWVADVGVFRLRVLGPPRRYAGPNDGSLVLLASAAGRTVLLPGDIEAIAQTELGPVRADVMKVPHQGAATSDGGWLAASAPEVAVISVGPNDFGHPSEDVVATLEESGAAVRRTDVEGTITIRLDRL
jgi:competence protein ComEC